MVDLVGTSALRILWTGSIIVELCKVWHRVELEFGVLGKLHVIISTSRKLFYFSESLWYNLLSTYQRILIIWSCKTLLTTKHAESHSLLALWWIILTIKTHGNSMEPKNQKKQIQHKRICNFIAYKSYCCLWNKWYKITSYKICNTHTSFSCI